MGVKILHTADLHLDRPYLGLGERRTARRAEMRARLEEILRLARTREAAAVLIAGDLFDRPAADSGLWVKGLLAGYTASGGRVFLIPGNHDSADSCDFYRGEFPPGVHVFLTPEFSACHDLPGVSVYGLAYHEAGRRRSPLAGPPAEPGNRWRVGLLHGQLRATDRFGDDYAPFTSTEVAASGFDYLALGHYHGRLDCHSGRTKAAYPGSPHRLDFGDQAERGVVLVDLDEEISMETIPLIDRPFLQIEGEAAQAEALYKKLIRAADPEAFVRVRLTGPAGAPLAWLLADLREKFTEHFYGLELQAREVEPAPSAAGPGTVAHAFARLMAERLAAAADREEEAELIRLAADYGRLALEGRDLP